MREWLIEETGDEDIGYAWDILLREDGDNRAKSIATCRDEQIAEQIVSGLKTVDGWANGMIRLMIDGVLINAKTGKVFTPPKKLPPKRVTSRRA